MYLDLITRGLFVVISITVISISHGLEVVKYVDNVCKGLSCVLIFFCSMVLCLTQEKRGILS